MSRFAVEKHYGEWMLSRWYDNIPGPDRLVEISTSLSEQEAFDLVNAWSKKLLTPGLDPERLNNITESLISSHWNQACRMGCLAVQFTYINGFYHRFVWRFKLSFLDLITECVEFDGSFDGDWVYCNGFSPASRVCTNAKECCKHTPMPHSCFNISKLKALEKLKQPSPKSRSFQRTASSCSRNDFRNLRDNITDKALDSQVIIWHKVITALQCSDYCLREPGCYGFNLETMKENKICELLGFGSNIVDRPGFSYWIFDRVSYEK
ncbi:unnamed protein product, partial [Porites lobata]